MSGIAPYRYHGRRYRDPSWWKRQGGRIVRLGKIAVLSVLTLAGLGAGVLGLGFLACTTHLLSDADKAKLESSVALEGQMYKDLAPDAGVPALVLRAETAGLYCSDESVLEGSGKVRPDAGLVCPRLK